ncbi:HPr kinase/phosphatase C-terminal domain-containing protein [Caenispirillum bisanense]|uniref:HPr kinase/phosphorylase n=1 Tax=Caenispirillum bisanense TaxID=414052 RepID=UPI0031D075EE
MTITLHATTVALGGRGVVLRGPSGSGKSDLALRLLDDGRGDARLVADDYTEVTADPTSAAGLTGAAPAAIAGLLEVRGVGILRLPAAWLHAGPVPLRLVVDLVRPEAVERLPPADAAVELLPGHRLPLVRLDPFAASAPAKVRLALMLAVGDILQTP